MSYEYDHQMRFDCDSHDRVIVAINNMIMIDLLVRWQICYIVLLSCTVKAQRHFNADAFMHILDVFIECAFIR